MTRRKSDNRVVHGTPTDLVVGQHNVDPRRHFEW